MPSIAIGSGACRRMVRGCGACAMTWRRAGDESRLTVDTEEEITDSSLVVLRRRENIVEKRTGGRSAPITVNSLVRTREYLTGREVERLMSAARKGSRWGHRDATMILIGYRHGLRASERFRSTRICCAMAAAMRLPMPAMTRGRCRPGSATRTSSTPSDTPSFRPTGSGTSGAISLDVACGRRDPPPVGGDFWILKIAHAPFPRNLSKNGFCPERG